MKLQLEMQRKASPLPDVPQRLACFFLHKPFTSSGFSSSTRRLMIKLLLSTLSFVVYSSLLLAQAPTGPTVAPILEFPQTGIDDTVVYRGYKTRFFRDSYGNAVQIILNSSTGRLVHLWADAANESISFTARTPDGRPASFEWESPGVRLQSQEQRRTVEHQLLFNTEILEVGHFLLCSMRKERDFQYFERHLLAFDSEPFHEPELLELIRNLDRLPADERTRHLKLLRAANVAELQTRMNPRVSESIHSEDVYATGDWHVVVIDQMTFDGKNSLSLELRVEKRKASIERKDDRIVIRSHSGTPVKLTVVIGTDSPSLTPLLQEQIFSSDFFRFYNKVKEDAEAQEASSILSEKKEREKYLRFVWLERQVKSLELLSYQEKLMAGLPNFATYFGRDMIMSALMLEPVWSPSMCANAITGILRKLSPSGEVSHEESLGGQAIRENAALYNKHIGNYAEIVKKNSAEARRLLDEAAEVLSNLQSVREDYKMLDDDFQFPVLAARYLTRSDVSLARKKAFLLDTTAVGTMRLRLLVRNLIYVTNRAAPYVERPNVMRLVGFPKMNAARWLPGSWRDSNAGYGNGRFAMDINVVWVPKALEATQKILETLEEIGLSPDALEKMVPEISGTTLALCIRNPALLRNAVNVWRGASSHFSVSFSKEEIRRLVLSRLAWLPDSERQYWLGVFEKIQLPLNLRFLALSLDSIGKPIPIANTDPAMLLFLEDFTERILRGSGSQQEAADLIDVILAPYPVGLFVDGLGSLVANDAYASRTIWEEFRRDRYHSPYVIWGREVNLLLLGLWKQIAAAHNDRGQLRDPKLETYVRKLRGAMQKTLAAVEASGLKHNELWTYRIEGDRLVPARYPTGSDIQLWNVTDLAVQFVLDRQKGN